MQLWLPVPPYPRWQSDQSEFFSFSMPGIFWKVTSQAFAVGFFIFCLALHTDYKSDWIGYPKKLGFQVLEVGFIQVRRAVL